MDVRLTPGDLTSVWWYPLLVQRTAEGPPMTYAEWLVFHFRCLLPSATA